MDRKIKKWANFHIWTDTWSGFVTMFCIYAIQWQLWNKVEYSRNFNKFHYGIRFSNFIYFEKWDKSSTLNFLISLNNLSSKKLKLLRNVLTHRNVLLITHTWWLHISMCDVRKCTCRKCKNVLKKCKWNPSVWLM